MAPVEWTIESFCGGVDAPGVNTCQVAPPHQVEQHKDGKETHGHDDHREVDELERRAEGGGHLVGEEDQAGEQGRTRGVRAFRGARAFNGAWVYNSSKLTLCCTIRGPGHFDESQTQAPLNRPAHLKAQIPLVHFPDRPFGR